MNAIFRELFHVGIYKRSQGRITRQVTWAAVALTMALGLWQLSGALEAWDPNWRRDLRAQAAGTVKIIPNGEIVVVDPQGRELEKHKIPEGAERLVEEGQPIEPGQGLLRYDPLRDVWLRAGLCFGLPALLLAAGLWVAYRLVNVPSVADFLIAVEAEMNKVSWPTRAELVRASMVVLITIFALAAILFGFDSFWRWFFELIGIFQQREAAATAMAELDVDWHVLLIAVTRVL